LKSPRQLRAEELAKRFRSVGRKPIVLEFSGSPKAGKTTTLGQLQIFLKRCGFRVETVVERASVCPIRDKKNSNFNVWTATTTLGQVLEKTQSPPSAEDPDVLILDRGLFDSICWLTMMERLSRIRHEDLDVIDRFLRVPDWRKRITAVVVMTAAPADSLDREQGYLPIVGATGSIMNLDVLQQMLNTINTTIDRLKSEFRIRLVDTSSTELKDNPTRTVETVADIALDIIEEQLREEILFAPRAEIAAVFDQRISLRGAEAGAVMQCFSKHGEFLPRDQVEKNSDVVQALPVVIVRNKSGAILRLRRKEASGDNPLHEKLVIWAGGHVRSEDGSNGEAIVRCAVRELQEELRLSIEPTELLFLGSVFVQKGERTSKHVALVYEWTAETDDVAIVLSTAEFFERRGTSLSGRFVNLDDLIADAVESSIEPWSLEIIREFLAADSKVLHKRLF